MVSKVCSRSHGQPPGARKRAMMSTSCWNFSPTVGDTFQFNMAGRGAELCGVAIRFRLRRAWLQRLEVCHSLGMQLFLFLDVLENPGEVVIEARGIGITRRANFFHDFVFPYHNSSPIISSGVHKAGASYPRSSTTRRIAPRSSALAICRQFQVSRYSQPCTDAIAMCTASIAAFRGIGPLATKF